ncbi:MAG TPA: ATP-binding protein [Candidatus Limnocylindrales bacterium]|nr:ATP-binding protein [Candidatus Limnocylindrales bacterium]
MKLSKEELRTLFLFEALDDAQLQWLVDNGQVEEHKPGVIYNEGEDATCFYVLLSGTVSLSRTVHGENLEVSRTEQRGVYAGATQAYLGDRVPQKYPNSLRAITDCVCFVLPATEFAAIMRRWFPMALHLMEGLFFGMRNMQTLVSERERLLALGSLSAGLTHELNNPAAAAVRATSVLRDRIAGMRHKLAMVAEGCIDPNALQELVGLQEEAVKRVAQAPTLTPLQASDAEDALGDWLDSNDIAGAWDMAPTLVAGGADPQWMDHVAATVGPTNLEAAIRWLSYTLDTELLMSEITDSVTRISTLVAAAKQYSQLDRTPYQVVDVHDLLKATLVMLNSKVPSGVQVVKEFDRTIPSIPAYAAELNQVWTNMIDNALGAMGPTGTLTLRTGRDGDNIYVEIADTGPGIDPAIRPRIFEPFFTTKPVGEGTGLGLDICYRIVVNKHHGDIRVTSTPGDTRFRVLLPINPDADQ